MACLYDFGHSNILDHAELSDSVFIGRCGFVGLVSEHLDRVFTSPPLYVEGFEVLHGAA